MHPQPSTEMRATCGCANKTEYIFVTAKPHRTGQEDSLLVSLSLKMVASAGAESSHFTHPAQDAEEEKSRVLGEKKAALRVGLGSVGLCLRGCADPPSTLDTTLSHLCELFLFFVSLLTQLFSLILFQPCLF